MLKYQSFNSNSIWSRFFLNTPNDTSVFCVGFTGKLPMYASKQVSSSLIQGRCPSLHSPPIRL